MAQSTAKRTGDVPVTVDVDVTLEAGDRGVKGPIGPVGPAGERGDEGPKGPGDQASVGSTVSEVWWAWRATPGSRAPRACRVCQVDRGSEASSVRPVRKGSRASKASRASPVRPASAASLVCRASKVPRDGLAPPARLGLPGCRERRGPPGRRGSTSPPPQSSWRTSKTPPGPFTAHAAQPTKRPALRGSSRHPPDQAPGWAAPACHRHDRHNQQSRCADEAVFAPRLPAGCSRSRVAPAAGGIRQCT